MCINDLSEVLEQNRKWAEQINLERPGFFSSLAEIQTPDYLWIGCADSRVPANEIVDMLPGELFVHRNVANLVVHTDLNCLSVIQYAVEVLKVKHIIVVGHYGCGGVRAAIDAKPYGLIDNWLKHISMLFQKHRSMLSEWEDDDAKFDRVCELNVVEQACNVCETTIVQKAWAENQDLTVHGWIYGLEDGRVVNLGFHANNDVQVKEQYRKVLGKISRIYSLARCLTKSEQSPRVLWERLDKGG